jgi:tetratricopeptide (TPR) repeat protein
MRAVFITPLLAFAFPLFAQTPLIDQGRALYEKGDSEKAAAVLEKAVAATPKSADAHYLLGAAYGQQAMTASIFSQMSLAGKSREQLEEAVRLDPNHLDARMGLMQFLTMAPSIAGGSESKAMEQAAEIKKRDPFRGAAAYAYIYNHDKKPELARKEYVDLVRANPTSPKAHLSLGVQYIFDKNYAAASTEVETALKLDPNYQQAWFRTGQLAALAGTNYARGEEALRKYLAYTPKPNEIPHYRTHYWLGQILEKTGRKSEAKAAYEASLKLRGEQKDVIEALKRVS